MYIYIADELYMFADVFHSGNTCVSILSAHNHSLLRTNRKSKTSTTTTKTVGVSYLTVSVMGKRRSTLTLSQ